MGRGGGENKTTWGSIKTGLIFFNPHLLKTSMSINNPIVNRIKVV